MKITYEINHFDFLKPISGCGQHRYIAQSKNGTWHGFTHKPIIDEQFQMWKPNPAIRATVREFILFDPFDGYPENLEWKTQLYTTQKALEILSNQKWYTMYVGREYRDFIGQYVLFMDGTFGVIILLNNGRYAIKSFSNTFISQYDQKLNVIELFKKRITENGIIADRNQFKDMVLYTSTVYMNMHNKFKIATILQTTEIKDLDATVEQHIIHSIPVEQGVACQTQQMEIRTDMDVPIDTTQVDEEDDYEYDYEDVDEDEVDEL